MRIAIYGAGGVGGYFGTQLIRNGEAVIFIARGSHLEAIRQHGLTLISPTSETLVQPELATDDPAAVGPVDAIILCVKAEQVTSVAHTLQPLLRPETMVIPLQNGVEAAAQLRAVLGKDHVTSGLCGTVSWVTGPGHIRTIGDNNFIRFGELDNRRSARTNALQKAFERAGVKAEIPPDIQKALWEKFLFVASLGGVGAMRQQAFGAMREETNARRMIELSMREIYSLALARGVALDADTVPRTLAFVDSLPAEGTTSLQRDIAAGKPSELDAWNGAVVRLAAEVAVDVPVHRFIYESLLPLELAARAAR